MSEPETGSIEQLLCDLLRRWCEMHRLPFMSASDIVGRPELSFAQVEWLTAYIILWERSEADFERGPEGTS